MNYWNLLWLFVIPSIRILCKIYIRLTVEKIQFVFRTANGKSIKTQPVDPDQGTLNEMMEFLEKRQDSNYMTMINNNTSVFFPRAFLENCMIKTRIVRRFGLEIEVE